jgi:hypothetical protein
MLFRYKRSLFAIAEIGACFNRPGLEAAFNRLILSRNSLFILRPGLFGEQKLISNPASHDAHDHAGTGDHGRQDGCGASAISESIRLVIGLTL